MARSYVTEAREDVKRQQLTADLLTAADPDQRGDVYRTKGNLLAVDIVHQSEWRPQGAGRLTYMHTPYDDPQGDPVETTIETHMLDAYGADQYRADAAAEVLRTAPPLIGQPVILWQLNDLRADSKSVHGDRRVLMVEPVAGAQPEQQQQPAEAAQGYQGPTEADAIESRRQQLLQQVYAAAASMTDDTKARAAAWGNSKGYPPVRDRTAEELQATVTKCQALLQGQAYAQQQADKHADEEPF